MSRVTSRTNIKILVILPDADAQEEAKKIEKKMLKRMSRKKNKNASNKKDKKTPTVDESCHIH
jgi:hypothetical protein